MLIFIGIIIIIIICVSRLKWETMGSEFVYLRIGNFISGDCLPVKLIFENGFCVVVTKLNISTLIVRT